MKNKIIFFISILLSSCGPMRQITIESVDLKRYANEGFLITQSSYTGNTYIPIGIIRVEVTSGYEYDWNKKKKDTSSIKPLYVPPQEIYGNKIYTESSLADAIEFMYQEAIKQGANAIINLQYIYLPEDKVIPRWIVLGMAIKINQQ